MFVNGTRIGNAEERIREYCDIEIYRGYDDCHSINDTITIDDINAANILYAGIDRFDHMESQRILRCVSVSPLLRRIEDVDLGNQSSTEWSGMKERIRPLLSEFLSIQGVGLAKAMKILHLKRPRLFPILDAFVIKFLTGIDISGISKDRLFDIGMKALDISRSDIINNLEAFDDLQRKLTNLPIPLTTVRMYDILCWTTEKWVVRGNKHAPYGIASRSVGLNLSLSCPRIKTGSVEEAISVPSKLTEGKYWVNVDKPTKKCTIHAEGCQFERGKYETPLKGIGELRKDGGWLSFSSLEEAEGYCNQAWKQKGYVITRHC